MKIIFEIMNIIRPAKTMNYKKVLPFNPNARGIPIPVLSSNESCLSCKSCEQVCPTHSLKIHSKDKMSFDYGACLQCGRCSEFCSDKKIIDSGFVHVYSTDREALKVTYTNGMPDEKPEMETEEVKRFRKTTKKTGFQFREVAASGNNTTEAEINASFNALFDSEASKIRVVASPKHADALVYSGPVGPNMEEPLNTAWETMPSPKALVACGSEAVSGGLFKLGKLPKEPDLFIGGDPPRPDVIISAFRYLMGTRELSFTAELVKFVQNLKKTK
ncbi:NADH-quinone oxidoreductase subunit B family protein [Leptospira borgpetersenii]|uniref:Metal (Ni/Fe) hydrogenase, small subunit n=2 Tax=Leptospira borgpetersenii serovar Hardjo-bovis TaxID=338217 RepID=Q04P25_LEPBJ|nr:4Fe-4S dicluster domain-containing protein [Leptospira borgpetersenii]ABJ77345.1 Metal (Ni/Fe) hydrogenase, small subunit [Leptospira borgpetersenii serovar Hardjo-bovis str. JB197]ABJ77736.1 Metal (Ni/Fe) hydrogenase, small subunit [Leptospira borgpetersenii serovar Hardjo-bovis str. L550]AMX56951.1 metal (Ni/Fe) hydrogenase small subunit [Leptospira borgpetersenii serovar Hardjo]AMX60182.1 metal (Ni/Fe) hydrogenase small subunit [Leptospira borgpetersenii serovar Hardjo]AMX63429.1 metal (